MTAIEKQLNGYASTASHSFIILWKQQYGKKGEEENRQEDSKVHVQLEPLTTDSKSIWSTKQNNLRTVWSLCLTRAILMSLVENVAIKTNASLILISVSLLLIDMWMAALETS